jgi:hypothetical protein
VEGAAAGGPRGLLLCCKDDREQRAPMVQRWAKDNGEEKGARAGAATRPGPGETRSGSWHGEERPAAAARRRFMWVHVQTYVDHCGGSRGTRRCGSLRLLSRSPLTTSGSSKACAKVTSMHGSKPASHLARVHAHLCYSEDLKVEICRRGLACERREAI